MDTQSSCSLCGNMIKKPKQLYGYTVDKKCYIGFVRRREWAYAIDFSIFKFMSAFVLGGLTSGIEFDYNLKALVGLAGWLIFTLIFSIKDGFQGRSPGKAMMGLRVVEATSGRPIGFVDSFKRNLLVSPLLLPLTIVALFQINYRYGYRIGDGWAKSRVIWEKYRGKAPFAVGTPEL